MFKSLGIALAATAVVFSFELSSPLVENSHETVPLNDYFSYYLWGTGAYETPLDTISLGKFGSLYLVKSEHGGNMEQPGDALLLIYTPLAGSTNEISVGGQDHWIASTVPLSGRDYSRYEMYNPNGDEGTWLDSVSIKKEIPIIEFTSELGVPGGDSERELCSSNTYFVEAEDGSWCKFRFTVESGTTTSGPDNSVYSSDKISGFQYTVTSPGTMTFASRSYQLGDTAFVSDLAFPDSKKGIVPYAYDEESDRMLFRFVDVKNKYAEEGKPSFIEGGSGVIINQNGDSYSVHRDAVSGTYELEYSGTLEFAMSEDFIPASWVLSPRNEIYSPIESSIIQVDSMSRDSLWGIYSKPMPVSRATHVIHGDYGDIALGINDSVMSYMDEMESDTLMFFELIDLFVGTDVEGGAVKYAQVQFYKDQSVSVSDEIVLKKPGIYQGKQKVEIYSLNGRLLHQFSGEFNTISAQLNRLNLSSGVYMLRTPNIVRKFSVK